MKTFKSLFVAFVCMMVSNVALADDRPIPVEQLPASAKTFVTNNFQGKKILYAEKVPTALVPAAIKQYVNSNYGNCMITKIDKERYGYDIELSNDLELKFNRQGALIGMDD